jgi:hypothetical protein
MSRPVHTLALLVASLTLPQIANAATWVVQTDGLGDAPTLQDAIDLAADGDEIVLTGGDFGSALVEERELRIAGTPTVGESVITGLVVRGASTQLVLEGLALSATMGPIDIREADVDMVDVLIDGENRVSNRPVLNVLEGADVSFRDSLLANWGSAREVISVRGSRLVLTGSTIAGNEARGGSVLFADGSVIEARGTRFANNTGLSGGSIDMHGGLLRVAGSTFRGGSALESGGHIRATGSDEVLLEGSRFIGATAGLTGGSLALIDVKSASVSGCDFADNLGMNGGAIGLIGDTSLVGEDLGFRDNQATRGGHLDIDGASADLARVRMMDGGADLGGAASVIGGLLSISNLIAVGHEASLGGVFFQDEGVLDARFCVFAENGSEHGAVWLGRAGFTYLGASIVVANLGEGAFVNDGDADVLVWTSIVQHDEAFQGDVERDGMVMSANPRFKDPSRGDFVLRTWSPALDTVRDSLDLDGTTADMGAFGGPLAWPLPDRDGDGFVHGRDCDDLNDAVNETAVEIWYDGVDSDCRGDNDFDQDHDGWRLAEDPDDTNPRVGGATRKPMSPPTGPATFKR